MSSSGGGPPFSAFFFARFFAFFFALRPGPSLAAISAATAACYHLLQVLDLLL